jgi:hypothetical protein
MARRVALIFSEAELLEESILVGSDFYELVAAMLKRIEAKRQDDNVERDNVRR